MPGDHGKREVGLLQFFFAGAPATTRPRCNEEESEATLSNLKMEGRDSAEAHSGGEGFWQISEILLVALSSFFAWFSGFLPSEDTLWKLGPDGLLWRQFGKTFFNSS